MCQTPGCQILPLLGSESLNHNQQINEFSCRLVMNLARNSSLQVGGEKLARILQKQTRTPPPLPSPKLNTTCSCENHIPERKKTESCRCYTKYAILSVLNTCFTKMKTSRSAPCG